MQKAELVGWARALVRWKEDSCSRLVFSICLSYPAPAREIFAFYGRASVALVFLFAISIPSLYQVYTKSVFFGGLRIAMPFRSKKKVPSGHRPLRPIKKGAYKCSLIFFFFFLALIKSIFFSSNLLKLYQKKLFYLLLAHCTIQCLMLYVYYDNYSLVLYNNGHNFYF